MSGSILGTIVILGAWKLAPWFRDGLGLALANRAIDSGELDDAEIRLDRLIREKPAQVRPRLLRARVALLRGEITQGEEILQRAVDLGLPLEEARAARATRPVGQQPSRR